MGLSEKTAASGAELRERAMGLFALLDDEAPLAEARGELTEPVLDALHDAGMFGLWLPAALGGAELDWVSSLDVLSQVAYGDASVGWVVMASNLSGGATTAYLGDDAVAEMCSSERAPVLAGQGTRPGKATPVGDDAFILNGEWNFGSGIKHADYVISLAIVEGSGEFRLCVVPRSEVDLIENWDVMGLRATGSVDYTISGVKVPKGFTTNAASSSSTRGGSLYSLGFAGLSMLGHTAWTLGTGRRLLDELLAMIQEKAGRPGAAAHNAGFQGDLAAAEARYRAARAFAYETWGEVQETLDQGDPLSLRQQTLFRLAQVHATRTTEEVSQFAYSSAGTTALRNSTLQRLFRDAHAGAQHLVASRAVQQRCGLELAGTTKGSQWVIMDLVEKG